MNRAATTSISSEVPSGGEECSKDRRQEVDWSPGKGKRLNCRCAGAGTWRGGGLEWGGAELTGGKEGRWNSRRITERH